MVLINVHITFFWLSIHSAHVSNGVNVYNWSSLHLIDTTGDVQQLTLRLWLKLITHLGIYQTWRKPACVYSC